MTRITVIKDKNGKTSGFKVVGHSGYAAEGEDIVCAGISSIVQTTMLGLLKYLPEEPRIVHEKGNVECFISEPCKELREAEILIGTMLAGLAEIAAIYPEFCLIEEKIVKYNKL